MNEIMRSVSQWDGWRGGERIAELLNRKGDNE